METVTRCTRDVDGCVYRRVSCAEFTVRQINCRTVDACLKDRLDLSYTCSLFTEITDTEEREIYMYI